VLAGLLLAASVLVSDLRFADRWHDNPTGQFLAHLQDGLPASGSANLFDAQLPEDVLSPLYRPYNTVSALLRQLPGRARFDDGSVPQSLVADDGRIRAAQLRPATRGEPGPVKGCGYHLEAGGGSVTVPLQAPVFAFVGRSARIELLLSAPTRVTVRTSEGLLVGSRRVLPRGPAAVVGLVPGGSVSGFTVSGLDAGASACVLQVVVGAPEPL
jgi:hypothetical protein